MTSDITALPVATYNPDAESSALPFSFIKVMMARGNSIPTITPKYHSLRIFAHLMNRRFLYAVHQCLILSRMLEGIDGCRFSTRSPQKSSYFGFKFLNPSQPKVHIFQSRGNDFHVLKIGNTKS